MNTRLYTVYQTDCPKPESFKSHHQWSKGLVIFHIFSPLTLGFVTFMDNPRLLITLFQLENTDLIQSGLLNCLHRIIPIKAVKNKAMNLYLS